MIKVLTKDILYMHSRRSVKRKVPVPSYRAFLSSGVLLQCVRRLQMLTSLGSAS